MPPTLRDTNCWYEFAAAHFRVGAPAGSRVVVCGGDRDDRVWDGFTVGTMLLLYGTYIIKIR